MKKEKGDEFIVSTGSRAEYKEVLLIFQRSFSLKLPLQKCNFTHRISLN